MYKHERGASIIIPYFPDDEPLMDRHRLPAQMQVSGFGIADAATFDDMLHDVNSRRPVIPPATLEKPPSAELRPNQKDTDTLPPYEVIDAVLEDYVEDSHPPERIAADHGFDVALVRRVIGMVDRAEYKRQQAAPGIKISPKAFGYGRRLPIAAKCEV